MTPESLAPNGSLELTSGQRAYTVPVLPRPLAAQFKRYTAARSLR
jgi:hypothetical protein